MPKRATKKPGAVSGKLMKTPSGIAGLDEIMEGGFPQGRPTLICGSAGCGKTLMAAQFLMKGITDFSEPGVFVTFEEPAADLIKNVSSLGFDLQKMCDDKVLKIDHVAIEKNEIDPSGEYDLEGLFIRLDHAIKTVKAKRVVLDTIESLFSGFGNTATLRSEMRRLFQWLKTRGVTTVITGERGDLSLTRQGLEEYVSDCVILLDFRVVDQISTRRLRVVKYRGSTHGTNEYPFLIDDKGIWVLPITSLKLEHKVADEIVSTGVKGLDEMFNNGGFYRGSTVMVSGTAGTAKTTLASYFACESCRKKERVLYLTFEESPDQLIHNMSSIGLDMMQYVNKGLLQVHACRPSLQGLEMHLLILRKMIDSFRPHAVIMDPISNLITIGSISEVRGMLVRLIDMLKLSHITGFFTSLTQQNVSPTNAMTEESISSLVDCWISLRDVEGMGERNRGLYILKARGMGHSNEVKEFLITDSGIKLLKLEIGPEGVLTGSARSKHHVDQSMQKIRAQRELDRRDREMLRRKKILEANIEAMRIEYESAIDELNRLEMEGNGAGGTRKHVVNN